MDNIEKLYKTWDDFLIRWPISAVETMKLDEYTGLEDKETFTYWLEHRLIEYGSIRGGSAYKFGVFRKADTSKDHPTKSYISDDKYAWHEKFGATSAEAFANVKQYILDIITAVESNELPFIESCPLAHTLKWKVAFHYQDQQLPTVLGVFNLGALQTHLDKKLSMAEALKVISNELTYETLITKTNEIWNEWADLKSINVWKISHGAGVISDSASNWLDEQQYLTVHRDTGHSQGKAFISSVKTGDYAYLIRSSLVRAVIKVTSDIISDENSPLDDDWLLRSYQVVYWLDTPKKYTVEYKKGWTPNYNSTIKKVPLTEIPKFECELLQPFFNMSLAQLILEGDNIVPDYEQVKTATPKVSLTKKSAKNIILYGPPGTGKTYQTITSSVMAAEPLFDTNVDRKFVKDEYERLVTAGRIQFVTFHQSYGYEEFVEGLKAKSNNGDISYSVESGIFKSICDAARDITKASNFLKIGDEFGSFLVSDLTRELIVITKQNGSRLPMPRCIVDELVKLVETKGLDIKNSSGDMLKSLGSNAEAYLITGYKTLHSPMCEELIKRKNSKNKSNDNFVLVIDEINRGNISKIFGELITLIEPSKRAGQTESLTIRLPYSQDEFSVPDNLYIIGTMNTADRSLAMMDTALRRRFDFEEMMPNLSVLKNCTVKGIKIDELLRIMNERIETLYDREHTLGHAFFIPVKEAFELGNEDVAWQTLQSIFQNKILPLLEEYFFEDWEKIRLVLGDNQKLTEDYQFVIKEELDNEKLKSLFGGKYKDDNYLQSTARYSLNKSAFSSENAYKYIITGELADKSTDTPEE
jgi:5-methylcytosine-specific restriction endonuclease McrBC GTP-binding regulatory subunit McrB